MKKELRNTDSKYKNQKKNLAGRWLLRIFVIFLLITNFIALGMNSDFVKNKIAYSVLDYINSKTGFSASLDNIDLNFRYGIKINRLLIKDRHNNTFLYASAFETGLMKNLIAMLVTKRYDFSSVSLKNANLNIKKYKGDSLSNLNYFIKKLAGKKKQSKSCMNLDVDKIELHDIVISNDRYDKPEIDSFVIGDALIDVKNIDLCENDVEFEEVFIGKSKILFANTGDNTTEKNKVDLNSLFGFKYKFKIGKLRIEDSYLSYKHIKDNIQGKYFAGHFNKNDIEISDIYIEGKDWELNTAKESAFVINKIRFKEKNGFELHDFSVMKLIIDKRNIKFKNLFIETENSKIYADLDCRFKDLNDFKQFVDEVKIKGDFKKSTLGFADAYYFNSGFNTNSVVLNNINKKIGLSGNISGNINNLISSGFSISIGTDFLVKLGFNIKNITRKHNEYLDLRNIKLKTSTEFIVSFFKNINFEDKFPNLGNLKYTGSFKGGLKDFIADGKLKTDLGTAFIDMNTSFESIRKGINYKGILTLKDFDTGKLLGNKDLGKTGGQINLINGYNILTDDPKGNIAAFIDSVDFKGYKYRNADIKAIVEYKKFNGDLKLKDQNVDFSLSGVIDFLDSIPVFNLKADIGNLDLHPLNLYKRDLKLSGNVFMDFMGSNPDDFAGDIRVKNLIVSDKEKQVKVDSIYISSILNDNGERYLDVDSDLGTMYFDGEYKLKNIYKAVYNMFDRHFSKFISGLNKSDTASGDFSGYYYDFSLDLPDTKDIFEILTGEKLNFNKLLLEGNADHSKDSLSVDLKFANCAYKENDIKDFSARFNLFKGYGDFHLHSEGVNFPGIEVGPIGFDTDVDEKELYFQLAIDSLGKNLGMIAFSGRTEPFVDSFGIEIYGGFITALQNELEFAGQNKIVIGNKYINLDGFVLNDNKGRLSFEDFNNNKGVKVDISNIDIGIVDLIMKYNKLKFSGNTNGNLSIPDIFKRNYLEGNINVPDLKINEDYYGELKGIVKIDSLDKSKLTYNITLGNETKMLLSNGFYNLKEKTFYGDFSFDKFPLAFLENIIGDGISGTQGALDGELRVYGPFKRISITGNGIVHNGQTKVNYLGVKYFFDNQRFILNDKGIDFTGVTITDKFGNPGYASGGITYDRFRHWGVDVTLTSDKILGLNTTKEQNPDYWGVGIGKMTASFKGGFEDLIHMDIDATTDKGTELTIPVKLYVDSGNESFVKFTTHKNDKITKKTVKKEVKFDVELNIDITSDAKMTLIMDENAGDNLTGKGQGKIRLLVKEDGAIEMYGDFKFYEGKYLFTLYKVVNKEFLIRPGSTITWSGDPFDAIMDIKADYPGNKVSLKNFLSEYEDIKGANYKADVDLILLLGGSLSKPEINFDFNFSNEDERLKTYIVSKMQRLKSDVNALNTQVVGIMVFGSFLPDENIGETLLNQPIGSTGQSAFYNTVSEFLVTKLSGYLTGLLSEIITDSKVISDIDISFSSESNTILSTGKTPDANSYLPQYLNLNATLWFFDNKLKVQFGGGYTGRSDIVEKRNFFSGENVNMEFYLTEDKRLKIKMFFNRDYNEIKEEWEIKSGLGLGYGRDFGKIYKNEN